MPQYSIYACMNNFIHGPLRLLVHSPVLCQAAWGSVKVRNSGFARWFWSHQGHIGQKKAIIAVSRKLLKMIYILLEKGQYYDPNYAVKATE